MSWQPVQSPGHDSKGELEALKGQKEALQGSEEERCGQGHSNEGLARKVSVGYRMFAF